MTPQSAVAVAERQAPVPAGPGDRFSGFAVIGLPFTSGHVLALRRFSVSSLGQGYTSVWHRDPCGRWTFYSTAAPDQSCARYFGGQVACNVVTPIDLAWPTPWALRVRIRAHLDWRLTVKSSLATRAFNGLAALLPEQAWQMPALLRAMGLGANATLGTGPMNLTGRTPNGHRFVANPRRLWLIASSTAAVEGADLGAIGPLTEQAALGDLRLPQRGLFAIARARLERPISRRGWAATSGPPCGRVVALTTPEARENRRWQ